MKPQSLSVLAACLLLGYAPTTLLAEEPEKSLSAKDLNISSVRPVSDAGPSLEPMVSALADAYQSCCNCGRIVGGVGLYVVKPHFDMNPAYSYFIQGTGPGERIDIEQHMQAAPLVWLGYVGENGVGVRGRWWYFREDTSQTQLFPPTGQSFTVFSASALGAQVIANNPSAVNVTSKLQLQVADLEAVKNAAVWDWDFLFSGGLRYADLTQNYNASTPSGFGLVTSGNSLTSIGPVLALEARHPLCASWLSFYGSIRSSVLFGNLIQRAFGLATQSGGQANVVNAAHQEPVVSAEELEIGLEVHTRFNSSTIFGQVAMVGQEWFGAGNASRSAFGSFPTGAPVPASEISSNLGFFGLTVRLGVNY